jgi:hypothetical protein
MVLMHAAERTFNTRKTTLDLTRPKVAMQLTVKVADLLVNAGLGFGVGVVASVLLFRRESCRILM